MNPQQPKDILEKATEAMTRAAVPEGPPPSLMQQTMEKIKNQQNLPQTHRVRERIKIMKALPKLAAAAVVIVGVWLGLKFIGSGKQGIALAEVLDRIQAVPVFTYRLQMTTSGEPLDPSAQSPQNMSGTIWISNQTNAMKMEMSMDGKPMQTMYMLPQENRMITLMPESRQYMEFTLSEDMLKEYKQTQGDPREMIQRVIDSRYTDLGNIVINGIECRVIESDDPKLMGGMFDQVSAKLWFNAQTGYPVQWEMNIITNEGKTEMHMLIDDFRWDTEVDSREFEPVIPEGYTSLGTIQIPNMDETAAINGFRKYVELTGEYPETLSVMELMQGLAKYQAQIALAHPEWKELGKKLEAGSAEYQQQMVQMILREMMPIQMLGMFYAKLIADQKDPVYDNQVPPGDSGAVLLRWKLDENTCKVIYGDLTTGELPMDQLPPIQPEGEPNTL
jgi:outer membrane lipoprotein-sorting protein